MNFLNFLGCGKLGDFLHGLFAVKNVCEKKNAKANIYLYDLGWEYGINNTLNELKEILLNQDYVNSLNILKNYELDPIQNENKNTPIKVLDDKILEEGYYDLGRYIRSPLLFKVCWSELFSNLFDFEIKEYKWITYKKIDERFKNKILIHRKAFHMTNDEFPHKELINNYKKENFIFVSSKEKDYFYYPFKNDIDYYKVSTLDEWFTIINSSSMVVSNLTGIAVIAHSLDKLRIIELPYSPDVNHCIGEEKYSNNIFWYLNNDINNLK